jgi:hypothetical protein
MAPTATTAANAAAAKPTLAEQIVSAGQKLWDHILRLDAREAGLNLLISAAILLIAVGTIWILRKLVGHWLKRFNARAPGDLPKITGKGPKPSASRGCCSGFLYSLWRW